MIKIFITGMSGSGKSTIGQNLKNRGFAVVDIDEVIGSCNWYDNKTHEKVDYFPGVGKKWLYEHSWICDFAKIKEIIESRYSNMDFVFVVGIATNQIEFLDFFDKVFLLQLDDKILLHRLGNRETNDFAKNKEEQEYILETKLEFEKSMLNHGGIPVDARSLPEEVIDQVISQAICSLF